MFDEFVQNEIVVYTSLGLTVRFVLNEYGAVKRTTGCCIKMALERLLSAGDCTKLYLKQIENFL